jgi:hypothetical protein
MHTSVTTPWPGVAVDSQTAVVCCAVLCCAMQMSGMAGGLLGFDNGVTGGVLAHPDFEERFMRGHVSPGHCSTFACHSQHNAMPAQLIETRRYKA